MQSVRRIGGFLPRIDARRRLSGCAGRRRRRARSCVAAEESPVRDQESSAVVPGVCDSTHGDDWVHCGACGSADFLPCLVASTWGRPHRSWRCTNEENFTKRYVRREEGLRWQADIVHIETVVDGRKMTERLTSPGRKHVGKGAKNATDELDGGRREGYLFVAPTAHCVEADMPDLKYITSVLMRTK